MVCKAKVRKVSMERQALWDRLVQLTEPGPGMLVGGIVIQAVEDYLDARRHLSQAPESPRDRAMLAELTEYFCSDDFQALTGLNGLWLLEKLEKESKQKRNRIYRKKGKGAGK